ncbi:MAG: HlyD family efflux transporter periplasmic adaptor subunit [Candidatus Delongbacteria bacterium]|nr:HlyD family efflux transporter periplasmic adaptor subunit [Candidatus Delongbacteria bacterium]
MSSPYRKIALERQSSLEQLDKSIKITSPMSWLALIGVTIIILVTIIWSIFGKLPTTVTVNGIIVSPVSTNAIFTTDNGTVKRISVLPGDFVGFGDEIITVKTSGNEWRTVTSTQEGMVSEILVDLDDSIHQGDEVVRISPLTNMDQVVVCYVPYSNFPKLEENMQVLVYLEAVDKQLYGYMVARIINIDSYASSKSNMSYVLGNDNSMADLFFSINDSVVAVTCELISDIETLSGYMWSNRNGESLTVKTGSKVSARIIIEQSPPITKLFIKFKEWWEG